MQPLPTTDKGKTILLAEDDGSLRRYATTVLEQHGYVVLAACDAVDALEISARHPEPIDLLLTDVHLGQGPNGVELANELRKQRRDLAVLVISGTADGEELAAQQGMPFLAKPFKLPALVSRIRDLLAAPPRRDKGCTADGG